jgi:hypothetical protein
LLLFSSKSFTFQYLKCIMIKLYVYRFIYMGEKLGLIVNDKIQMDNT